jgi:hypothetical protein
MDGRAERRALVGPDDGDRPAEYVGVDLHQQLVLQQATGDDELLDRYAVVLERLDDAPGAEGGALDQRAVAVLGAGRQGLPDQDRRQIVVDQDGPVAVVPVEGDQAVRADRLFCRELCQIVVDAEAPAGRSCRRTSRRCRRPPTGRPRSPRARR